MIYFTELEHLPTYDVKGEFLGRLEDLGVDPSQNPLRVASYLIKTPKKNLLCITYEQIQSISVRAIQTSVSASEIRCYAPDEGLLRVKKDIVDQQVIDVHHRKVVRVNDVDFDIQPVDGHTELRILAVNVKGVFFCSRAVVPAMKRQGAGCIVNISSVAGIRGGAGSSIAYCASKAAVINLTMAFARAFAPEVRVNCVAPGFIDTRWHSARPEVTDYDALKGLVAQGTPLARVCTPGDIAQVVLSLIEGADFVTGQTIVADGGGLMRG